MLIVGLSWPQLKRELVAAAAVVRGDQYVIRKAWAKAEIEYAAAVAMFPDAPAPRLQMARAQLRQGYAEKATATLSALGPASVKGDLLGELQLLRRQISDPRNRAVVR